MLPLKKILCPTDFSEPSYAALKTAGDLALEFDAELCVIHVMEQQEPVLGIISKAEFDAWRSADAAQRIHHQISEFFGQNLRARAIVECGNAAAKILEAADKEQPDLIVISTHGLTGWRHMVFGSVAEAVVRQSKQPVLTIRSK
jgi:nucleotide-binding universal stress UspA family protein